MLCVCQARAEYTSIIHTNRWTYVRMLIHTVTTFPTISCTWIQTTSHTTMTLLDHFSCNNWRHNCYTMRKELWETQPIVNTQQTETRSISDTQQACKHKRWTTGRDDQIHSIFKESSLGAEALVRSKWYSRSWSRDRYLILNCKWYSTNRRRRDWYSTNRRRRDRYLILNNSLASGMLVGSTWYSRNWRCDRFLILNEVLETRSIFNTLLLVLNDGRRLDQPLYRGPTPWRWSN